MSRFDYLSQGGESSLIYRLNDSEGVDKVALGMLKNNVIPGIVKMNLVQTEGERYLRYASGNLINLNQYFGNIVTKQKLLSVFSSIAETALEAEEYLIDAQMFVLKNEYIMVDNATGNAKLICLPLVDKPRAVEFATFFKNIVFTKQFDKNEDCGYIATISSFVSNAGRFSLVQFKKLLDDIASGTTVSRNGASGSLSRGASGSLSRGASGMLFQSGGSAPAHPAPAPVAPAVPLETEQAAAKQKKDKLGFWNRKKKESEVPAHPVSSVPESVRQAPAFCSEATTVLGSSPAPVQQKSGYLVRLSNGETAKLEKPESIIGKDPASCDYFITDNSAMSRHHAVIYNDGGVFSISDTNSTNHTYVNGTMIRSGVKVKIESGDQLRLANEDFGFEIK